jgi:uncharacterized protein with GYD domain
MGLGRARAEADAPASPPKEGLAMPIYITQGRYTGDAIKGMIAKPEDRTKAVEKLLAGVGGKLHGYYLTFGEYDFLLIAEARNEKLMASVILAAAGSGGVTAVRTTVALSWADARRAFAGAAKLAGTFKPAGGRAPGR